MASYPLALDLEIYRGDSFSRRVVKYWTIDDESLQDLTGAKGRAAFKDGVDAQKNDVWRIFTVIFTLQNGEVKYTKTDGTEVNLGVQQYWTIDLEMSSTDTEDIGVKSSPWELDIEFANTKRLTVYKGKVKISGEVIKKNEVAWSAPAA